MTGFLWTAGHVGWGIFALLVFSGLWLLLADLCWRLLVMKSNRLLSLLGVSWLIGLGIICAGFYFVGR